MLRGRFKNPNSKGVNRYGYPYGEDSAGEFPDNRNLFDINQWRKYSPYDTCASAQMIIKKER